MELPLSEPLAAPGVVGEHGDRENYDGMDHVLDLDVRGDPPTDKEQSGCDHRHAQCRTFWTGAETAALISQDNPDDHPPQRADDQCTGHVGQAQEDAIR